MFPVIRLAVQTTSRVVALFLDGDVSFLPDNSFPSKIQLLKLVCKPVSVCLAVSDFSTTVILRPLLGNFSYFHHTFFIVASTPISHEMYHICH